MKVGFLFKLVFLTVLLKVKYLSAQTDIEYGNNAANGNCILVNNVHLYFETYGEGQPLLLIHGNKTGISGWKPQIEFFAKYFKVIALDCRGRGKSELGNDTLSYMQMAKDVSQFIDLLNLDSVVIVGKSDGGIIGLLLGINFPANIKSIISFGANISPDTNALFPQVVKEIHNERINAENMILKGDKSDNWEIVRQRNRLMEFQPQISLSDLHKIETPILLMSCDRDVIKESHTFLIYQNIKKCNLSIFPGEVHSVTRKNPDLFNNTILNFLNRPFVEEDARFK